MFPYDPHAVPLPLTTAELWTRLAIYFVVAAAIYLLAAWLMLWMVTFHGGGSFPNPILMIAVWFFGLPGELFWLPAHRYSFDIEHGHRASYYVSIAINAMFWGFAAALIGALRARRRRRKHEQYLETGRSA